MSTWSKPHKDIVLRLFDTILDGCHISEINRLTCTDANHDLANRLRTRQESAGFHQHFTVPLVNGTGQKLTIPPL